MSREKTINHAQWKEKLREVSIPAKKSLFDVAGEMRSDSGSFMRTLRRESLTVKDLVEFCRLCDAKVLIKDAKGRYLDLF